MRKILSIGVASVLAASILTGCGLNSNPSTVYVNSEEKDKITVSSSKSVSAIPDMAELDVNIRTYADSADKAQKDLAERTNTFVSKLKENSIDEKSIQTESYNVWPDYDYSSGVDEIIGYEGSVSIHIKDQKVEDVGSLINLCTENGADSVEGLKYSCSNYNEVYAKALADAVESAKEKASIIAEAEGREVGKALEIVEGYQDTYYQYKSVDSFMMNDSVAEAKAVDIMPGEADIDADVTVSFEILD